MNNENIKITDTKEITEELLNEIENTEMKKIVIETKDEITLEQRMALESIKCVKNPFKMLTVKDIMQDLNICETVAYKTFRREDFPSINVGKNNQVMLIAYLIWKMKKRG